MEPDPKQIIDELLAQNSSLRLEIAVLSAMKKQQDDIERQMENSKNIPPEAMELISKLDIR